MNTQIHIDPTSSDYPKVYLYRRIVQAKIFIDKRYAERIDVSNIAGEACFSEYHFIRLFKRAYGDTPHQYLTRVRIERAKALLGDGLSVTAVCFTVGFESLGSFSTLFRKLVGHSPVSYRSAYQSRRREMLAAPLNFVPGCYISDSPRAFAAHSI